MKYFTCIYTDFITPLCTIKNIDLKKASRGPKEVSYGHKHASYWSEEVSYGPKNISIDLI